MSVDFKILKGLMPYLALAEWMLVTYFCMLGTLMMFVLYNCRLFRYTKKKNPISSQVDASLAPPVSILRPLKGVDCNLKENLASSFKQNYPAFELILSVADADDPAIQVVNELCREYPNVDARLIVGAGNIGVNPKVNNLIRGYETSKYEIIWILDSNIYVEPDCLARSVDELCKPGVGLVHHLPVGTRPESLGSLLEMAFMNTAHAKMYSAINQLAISSCVVGKSNLFRKSHLNSKGGFMSFGKFMSEDNILGQYIWDQDLDHRITSDLAYQTLGSMTFADYIKRRSRWARLRKYIAAFPTILEFGSESITCGIAGAYAFNHFLNVPAYTFFFFHMLIWFITDAIVHYSLSKPSVSIFGFLYSWIIREITAVHVYMYAVAGSTVEWRGKLYKLNRDGTVVLSQSKPVRNFKDLLARFDSSYWSPGTLKSPKEK